MKTLKGTSGQILNGNRIAATLGGGVSVVSTYSDQTILEDDTIQSPGFGTFLARYSDEGKLLWHHKAWSNGKIDWTCVTADKHGNSYVAGYHGPTLFLESGSVVSGSEFRMFVAKFDSTGVGHWLYTGYCHTLGNDSISYVKPISIKSDETGVVIVASIRGSVGGVSDISYFPNPSTVVFKIDTAGNVLWKKVFQGSGYVIPTDVTLDYASNVWITGNFGPVNGASGQGVGFGTTVVKVGHSQDVFVAQLNAFGNFSFVETMGGDNLDNSTGIISDNYYNIYLIGTFESAIVFQTETLKVDEGTTRCFLACFTFNCKYKWASSISESMPMNVWDVQCHDSAIYTGGVDKGYKLMRLDNKGNLQWKYEIGADKVGDVNAISMACGDGGSLFLYSTFSNHIISNLGTTAASGLTEHDGFLTKISADEFESLGLSDKTVLNRVQVYPNPSNSVIFIGPIDNCLRIELFNNRGQLEAVYPATEKLDITNISAGIYFLKAITAQKVYLAKFMKN